MLIDPDIGTVMKVVPLQYNPDGMSRTLRIRGAGEAGDRTEALRLTGPPVETIKLRWSLTRLTSSSFRIRIR